MNYLRESVENLRLCRIPAREGLFHDVEAVIAAYLAEHPADEDEAITEEWLRSVGFVKDWMKNQIQFLEYENGSSTVRVHGEVDGTEEWLVGMERVPHDLMPNSRGEVRQLFRKLNIPLQEPKAGGTHGEG